MQKNWELAEVSWETLTLADESYSGDKIAESHTVRKPFKFRGVFYVSVGGGMSGKIEGYQIIPREQFHGEPAFYGKELAGHADEYGGDWAEQRRNQPDGFYHAMLIKRGETEWVLVGPPLIFILAEGSTPSKQLELIEQD